ncbi:MAG: hypothetical protein JSS34_00350 [Proteobacteria bacterium]|nr:hypothetical protein [Pseudomonadota bacterium]
MFKKVTFQILMTILILWHSTSMIIAPSPSSQLTDGLYSVFGGYIETFGLFLKWGFFAPNPGKMKTIDFIIIDKLNKEHKVNPLKILKQSDSTYFRHMDLMRNSARYIHLYGPALTQYVCKTYPSNYPKKIKIQVAIQSQIPPKKYTSKINLLDQKENFNTYTYSCSTLEK